MKRVLFISLFSLLFSCQKKSEVLYSGERVLIKPTPSKILDLGILKWKAGILRNVVISKGVQIGFSFPQLEKKDLRHLVDKFGVDSWIVKVKRKGMMKSETVGYFSVPIILPGQKNSMRINQLNKASFRVLYAAAAASTRFSKLPCPAFKHDLFIEKFSVGNEISSDNKINVSPVEEERMIVAVEKFNYSETFLNGGKELRGNYFIEIAFYNKQRKVKLSSFYEIDGSAKVIREKAISLSGCDNYQIPARMEKKDGLKNFKWNN